jgi:hypothetical protein
MILRTNTTALAVGIPIVLSAAGDSMSWHFQLKIPKKLKQVTLWIHPEGRVVGSLFLHLQTRNSAMEEEPLDVLNEAAPFLVLKREDPDEMRFYNKGSIVRLEYQEEEPPAAVESEPLHCKLYMMDGSLIEGRIIRALPPTRSRLYDYLNIEDERFAKLHVEDGNVCLVNKSYIVCVRHLSDTDEAEAKWLPDAPATSDHPAEVSQRILRDQ